MLAEMKLDATAIAAALLHDAMEEPRPPAKRSPAPLATRWRTSSMA